MAWIYDRWIRTTQERRANGHRGVLDVEEYEIRVRGRRSAKVLPDSWDDPHGYYAHRSWKRYRKTQWKVKPIGDGSSFENCRA